jgi:hypothetical protein
MLKMIRQQSYLPLSFYFIYDRIENEAQYIIFLRLYAN